MELSSQPEFVIAATQDLLDELSLQTVLEMSAVMVTADELTQLESLTPAQKRQVWLATPEEVKLRLKQIKAAAQAESRPVDRSTEEKEKLEVLEELEESLEEMGEAIDGVGSESIDFLNLPLFQNSYGSIEPQVESTAQIGDWVVLKAEPCLTTAELLAVWKVVAIEGEAARIEAKGLGNRQYPMSWMVAYPPEEVEF
jgi:hypothetical protein